MKQITVIGATKGVGLKTVEMAIKCGYKVVALSRNFDNYPIDSPDLTKITGSALNEADCLKAINGSEAVVLAIGAKITLKPVTLYSEATASIIKVIEANQPKTLLIAVTGFGAGDSKGRNSFIANLLMFGFLLKTGYDDKTKQEELIKHSSLRWIIVRPAMLTDGALMRFYNVFDDLGNKPKKISRSDVANFILNEVEKPTHLYKTPLITY